MFEFFIFVVGLIIGYHVGAIVLAHRIRAIIMSNLDSSNNGLLDANPKPKVNQLFIEHINDLMYLYDKDANAFVCQGSTIDELAHSAKQLKNIKYAAVMDEKNNSIFSFVDGKASKVE